MTIDSAVFVARALLLGASLDELEIGTEVYFDAIKGMLNQHNKNVQIIYVASTVPRILPRGLHQGVLFPK